MNGYFMYKMIQVPLRNVRFCGRLKQDARFTYFVGTLPITISEDGFVESIHEHHNSMGSIPAVANIDQVVYYCGCPEPDINELLLSQKCSL